MANPYPHHSASANGSANRMNDLLEAVKNDYAALNHEVALLRQQREEIERQMTVHINEATTISQNIYELDRTHSNLKKQYEEEINHLRRQLDGRNSTAGSRSNNLHGGSNLPPASFLPHNQNAANDPAQLKANYSNFPPPSVPPPSSQPHDAPSINSLAHHALSQSVHKRPRKDEPPSHQPNNSKPGFGGPPNHSHTSNPGGPPNVKLESSNIPLPPQYAMEHHQVQGMRQGSISHHPMHHPEHLQPSARAPIRHAPNSHQGPPGPQGPTAFGEIDPDTVATQFKKEGDNWFAIFNPKIPHSLNVDLVHTLDHDSVVCCVRFSHDGQYLATGCNRTAQIYDVSSARKLYELVDDSVREDNLYIRAVCFSPDGKFLATGGEDHKIRIWDIQAKRVCSMFTGHTSDIYSLEFSNNGRLLVSGSGDKSVRVWDMESNQLKTKFLIESTNIKDPGVTCVAISPDSRYIAAGSLDKFVRVWDVQQDRILNIFEGHKDGVYSVAFSPDGKSLISGSLDNSLKLWQVGPNRNNAMANVTPSSCIANFIGHKDFVLSVATSPCGKWAMSGSKDRSIQFWDMKTHQTQFMLQGHKNSVISVAFNPKGTLFATGSGDLKARVWSYKPYINMEK